MDFKFKLCIIFLVTGSSISTSASAVTAASTTSTTSTSSGNKPPRPKWLHCNNCKSPFANAWDLMVHVQTAHMMNIYQLADTTKLQNVRFFSFSLMQKQNRQIPRKNSLKIRTTSFFSFFSAIISPHLEQNLLRKKIFDSHKYSLGRSLSGFYEKNFKITSVQYQIYLEKYCVVIISTAIKTNRIQIYAHN